MGPLLGFPKVLDISDRTRRHRPVLSLGENSRRDRSWRWTRWRRRQMMNALYIRTVVHTTVVMVVMDYCGGIVGDGIVG